MNKRGEAPIEMGINYQGKRVFINLPRKADPKTFPRGVEDYLNIVERRIREYETECLDDGEAVTVEGIREFIRGGWTRPGKSVDSMWRAFLRECDMKVSSGMMTPGVRRKYEVVWERFVSSSGIDPGQRATVITPGMVRKFCLGLDADYKNSSACGMKTKLKSIMLFGRDNGFMPTLPFQEKIVRREVEIVPLTPGEVDIIARKDLSAIPRVERVRDLFIFSCYTGLAFCDTQELVPEDIKERDGVKYIEKPRKKTGVPFTVVLLPEALAILEKYNYTLPRISNQKCNSFLSEIEAVTGIGKRLHFHLARHTAACMFLNKYKFRTEVTAKILGHGLKITQHYQKMFSDTVMDAFRAIK